MTQIIIQQNISSLLSNETIESWLVILQSFESWLWIPHNAICRHVMKHSGVFQIMKKSVENNQTLRCILITFVPRCQWNEVFMNQLEEEFHFNFCFSFGFCFWFNLNVNESGNEYEIEMDWKKDSYFFFFSLFLWFYSSGENTEAVSRRLQSISWSLSNMLIMKMYVFPSIDMMSLLFFWKWSKWTS